MQYEGNTFIPPLTITACGDYVRGDDRYSHYCENCDSFETLANLSQTERDRAMVEVLLSMSHRIGKLERLIVSVEENILKSIPRP